MDIELLSQPAGTAARVTLAQDETLTAEVGAMIAMSTALRVETTSRQKGGSSGIIKGLKRMFSGESFFLNHFTATSSNQEIFLGPKLMGDIVHHKHRVGTLIVQGASWLASSADIEVDTSFQGIGKALFSGESMFWVKCSGSGDILLNSFGAIYEIDVRGRYVVDTGHIVAFEDTLDFSVGKSGEGWIQSLLSGEGLVCHFKGQGKLYCQTHNPTSFGRRLGPNLKPRKV